MRHLEIPRSPYGELGMTAWRQADSAGGHLSFSSTKVNKNS
jgi:hypothetical protein